MRRGIRPTGRFHWRCLLCDAEGRDRDAGAAFNDHYMRFHYVPVARPGRRPAVRRS